MDPFWLRQPFATAVRFSDHSGASNPRPVLVVESKGDQVTWLEQGIFKVQIHVTSLAELLDYAWPDLTVDFYEAARRVAVAVATWLPCAPNHKLVLDRLLKRGEDMRKTAKKAAPPAPTPAAAEVAQAAKHLAHPKQFDAGWPKVFTDYSRRTCLALKRSEHTVYCIPMAEGQPFDVEHWNHERFERRYTQELLDYPVDRAAALYARYAQETGATPEALRWLGYIIHLSDKDLTMATKKAAAKAADTEKAPKAAAKKTAAAPAAKKGAAPKKGAAKTPGTEEGPKVREGSAASMFQELLLAGKHSDDEIFKKVQAKFGLDDKKRGYVGWYRNYLRKKGHEVPDPIKG